MLIVPSVDLSEGAVVRLAQGDPSRKTIYPADPFELAARYAQAGADVLHIVDLDGAFAGEPRHAELIGRLCDHAGLPVQVGGGIRSLETARSYLENGATRVVFGTAAVREPELVRAAVAEFGPERVVGALDAKEGRIAIRGWTETGEPVEDVGRRFREAGLLRALHTDVARDGIGTGPNLQASIALAQAADIRIIVSGGVSSIEDVARVASCGEPRIEGLIIGRALYEGKLDLAEACRIAHGTN
jgi:phosphoribosylformimino-5-aminoimidazole carboxamide ribotide isomerase